MSGSASERIQQKLKLAYYDKIAPDIEVMLAERDALREALERIAGTEWPEARSIARAALERPELVLSANERGG